MRNDGDSKLEDIVSLSKKVMSKLSSSGQEVILREVDCYKSEWNSLWSDVSQVSVLLNLFTCCY